MNTSVLIGTDVPVSFSISGGISATMTTGGQPLEPVVDVVHDASATYEISGGLSSSMAPSPGGAEFEAAFGTVINAGIRNYTGDEDLPDEVDGKPNPAKNILVDNNQRTIQAEVLTAAQMAALLS